MGWVCGNILYFVPLHLIRTLLFFQFSFNELLDGMAKGPEDAVFDFDAIEVSTIIMQQLIYTTAVLMTSVA